MGQLLVRLPCEEDIALTTLCAVVKVDVHPSVASKPLRRQDKIDTVLSNLAVVPTLAVFAAHFEDDEVLELVVDLCRMGVEDFASKATTALTSGRVCLLTESELASVPPAYVIPYFCYCA
jgi:hypothetical protein